MSVACKRLFISAKHTVSIYLWKTFICEKHLLFKSQDICQSRNKTIDVTIDDRPKQERVL